MSKASYSLSIWTRTARFLFNATMTAEIVHLVPWYNHSKPDQSNIVWGFCLASKNLLITFSLPASLRVLAYLHTITL